MAEQTVTAHLVIKGAAEAIAFYTEAFGARELLRMPSPDGKLWHASLAIGDSQVYLVDEFPGQCGSSSPTTLGGTPVTLHLAVEDADATFNQAVAAGATPAMPPADMFWGSRYGQVVDPFGHSWSVASPLSPEATEAAKAAFAAQMQPVGAEA
jgi:PhnB protein